MAHWAELDSDNKVLRVLVGDNNDPAGDEGYSWIIENLGGTWIKTSYNAGTNGFRYNFAGIGFTYDPIDDAFIAPMPQCGHDAMILNSLKRWECSSCDDDIRQRLAGIQE
tara:strand:+ start:7534 stop:7863 length:330 start_codon:yes stop_codon:yes gene_type:complete